MPAPRGPDQPPRAATPRRSPRMPPTSPTGSRSGARPQSARLPTSPSHHRPGDPPPGGGGAARSPPPIPAGDDGTGAPLLPVAGAGPEGGRSAWPGRHEPWLRGRPRPCRGGRAHPQHPDGGRRSSRRRRAGWRSGTGGGGRRVMPGPPRLLRDDLSRIAGPACPRPALRPALGKHDRGLHCVDPPRSRLAPPPAAIRARAVIGTKEDPT